MLFRAVCFVRAMALQNIRTSPKPWDGRIVSSFTAAKGVHQKPQMATDWFSQFLEVACCARLNSDAQVVVKGGGGGERWWW